MYETKLIVTLEENETINDALDLAKEKTDDETMVNLIITDQNMFFQVYSDDTDVGEDYKTLTKTYSNTIELNKEEMLNLKGFSDTITIDSEDGTGEVVYPFTETYPDYEVLTTVEDSLRAEVRVDKKDDKFIIRLFDSEGFVEYDQVLNCSETPVDVHYVVVLKKDN